MDDFGMCTPRQSENTWSRKISTYRIECSCEKSILLVLCTPHIKSWWCQSALNICYALRTGGACCAGPTHKFAPTPIGNVNAVARRPEVVRASITARLAIAACVTLHGLAAHVKFGVGTRLGTISGFRTQLSRRLRGRVTTRSAACDRACGARRTRCHSAFAGTSLWLALHPA